MARRSFDPRSINSSAELTVTLPRWTKSIGSEGIAGRTVSCRRPAGLDRPVLGVRLLRGVFCSAGADASSMSLSATISSSFLITSSRVGRNEGSRMRRNSSISDKRGTPAINAFFSAVSSISPGVVTRAASWSQSESPKIVVPVNSSYSKQPCKQSSRRAGE